MRFITRQVMKIGITSFKAIKGQDSLLKHHNEWFCALANTLKQVTVFVNVQSDMEKLAAADNHGIVYQITVYIISKKGVNAIVE